MMQPLVKITFLPTYAVVKTESQLETASEY